MGRSHRPMFFGYFLAKGETHQMRYRIKTKGRIRETNYTVGQEKITHVRIDIN